ncbi:glutaredoxin family protein [Marinospirillum sp. MEB164]|uniref:Glutaredoxin family protein n=1 Tax=Marinospirillum alkalitolerans TaxID=3123374 RepID=A0ABW8PVH3_9GAMM
MHLEVRLYTTLGCHLCEQAQALLLPWVAQGVQVELVDIIEDPQWVERYGVRIPVLATAQGAELGWPFDAEQLRQWLLESL